MLSISENYDDLTVEICELIISAIDHYRIVVAKSVLERFFMDLISDDTQEKIVKTALRLKWSYIDLVDTLSVLSVYERFVNGKQRSATMNKTKVNEELANFLVKQKYFSYDKSRMIKKPDKIVLKIHFDE